jgi:hypothetical protein
VRDASLGIEATRVTLAPLVCSAVSQATDGVPAPSVAPPEIQKVSSDPAVRLGLCQDSHHQILRFYCSVIPLLGSDLGCHTVGVVLGQRSSNERCGGQSA